MNLNLEFIQNLLKKIRTIITFYNFPKRYKDLIKILKMIETSKCKCSACGRNGNETEFYDYLKSKCKECKKKESKENRAEKKEKVKEMENTLISEKRVAKIQEIDPEEKIRYLCEELLLKEKVSCLRNKTVLDYIQDTDFELCELFDRYSNYKDSMKIMEDNIFEKINQININLNTLNKFKRDFDDLVEKRAICVFTKYIDENLVKIKNDIKDEILFEMKNKQV